MGAHHPAYLPVGVSPRDLLLADTLAVNTMIVFTANVSKRDAESTGENTKMSGERSE